MFLLFTLIAVKYGFLPLAAFLGLAGAAAGTVSSIIGANAQSTANREQLDYAREAYSKQRNDALADWAMQNQYNSPRAQMQRYQEAGLNPNLIYGQMTNSPAVRSVDMKSYDPKPAAFDPSAAISGFVDLASKTAQLDNLTAQNTVLKQEAELRKEQTAGVALDNKLKEGGLSFTLEGKKAQLARTRAETERTIISNSTSYREAIERILTSRMNRSKNQQEVNNLRQVLAGLKQDYRIKTLDEKRARNGQRPGESAVNSILNNLYGGWKSLPGPGHYLMTPKK